MKCLCNSKSFSHFSTLRSALQEMNAFYANGGETHVFYLCFVVVLVILAKIGKG